MTEQEQRLARAWMALAGWRVGMVDRVGQAFDAGGCLSDWVTDAENSDDGCLPELNSPANWGHWFAWAADTLGSASLRRSGSWWSAESNSAFSAEHDTPAAALMELYCRYLEDDAHEAAREWWRHELEESGG